MIRLSLLVCFAGGRRALYLIVVAAFAVAVGCTLLLLALTVSPAVHARTNRTAWMSVPYTSTPSSLVQAGSRIPHTGLLAAATDTFGTHSIDVILVSRPGPGGPLPPHFRSLPAAGKVFLSPALMKLALKNPPLRRRYGSIAGTVPVDDVGGPESLVAVRGIPEATLDAAGGSEVTAFPQSGQALVLTPVVRLLLLIGAISCLAPEIVIIVLSTRLSAVIREPQLAAFRLAGASRHQVALLGAAESLLAGGIGALTSIPLFFVTRPLASRVTYDGTRWADGDLNPGLWRAVIVLVAIPIMSACCGHLTLRRLQPTVFGSTSDSFDRGVSVSRVIVLAWASAALGFVLLDGRARSVRWIVLATFATFIASFLRAGPWFTKAVGVVLARSGRPVFLLAGRRLALDPRTGFRSVAGVVLAVLTTTIFVSATPAAVDSVRSANVTAQSSETVQIDLGAASSVESSHLLRGLQQLASVTSSALVVTGEIQHGSTPITVWIGPCSKIARAAQLTQVHCDGNTAVISRDVRWLDGRTVKIDNIDPIPVPGEAKNSVNSLTVRLRRAGSMPTHLTLDSPSLIISANSVGSLRKLLRPTLLLARTLTPTAIEQIRTLTLQANPTAQIRTLQSTSEGFNTEAQRIYRTLEAATFGVFLIAGFAIAVSSATGLVARHRPLVVLRASGADVRVIRASLVVEAIAPLVLMSTLATCLGALIGLAIARAGAGVDQEVSPILLALPAFGGTVLVAVVLLLASVFVGPATKISRVSFE